MDVTPDGMVIVVRPVHPVKAFSPMVAAGRLIEVSLVHSLNASLPMAATSLKDPILVTWLPLRSPAGIDVTPGAKVTVRS